VAARDGDGWVQCDCGNKHWGLHGAAGLLLVRDSMVLLQHREPKKKLITQIPLVTLTVKKAKQWLINQQQPRNVWRRTKMNTFHP
jgi:hypothetical protein